MGTAHHAAVEAAKLLEVDGCSSLLKARDGPLGKEEAEHACKQIRPAVRLAHLSNIGESPVCREESAHIRYMQSCNVLLSAINTLPEAVTTT